LHGYPANAAWHLVDSSPTHLSIGLDFPPRNALRRLVRTIRVDPMRASVDLKLTIEARNACRRTIAFHPSFALPDAPGAIEIVPDGFAFGIVQPQGPETGLSKALPSAQFEKLDNVPLAGGGAGVFDHLPFAEAREEILMLCGVTGGVSLNDRAAGVAYRMTWDNDRLPNLALWMSNRGRLHSPWNGRNLCVGVEPCVSAFGGILASLADNPVKKRGVATSLELHPGENTQLSYRISACLKDGAAHRN
jgi:hypothetical protein